LSPNRARKVGAVLVARDGAEIAACDTFAATAGACLLRRSSPASIAPARSSTLPSPASTRPKPDSGDPVSGGSFERSQIILREGVEIRIVAAGAR
jgi:hypothetical protein